MHSSESAGAALLLWTVQVLLQSALAELSLWKVQVMLLWWNYHFGQDSSGHASVCSEQFRSCFCEQFRSCFCLLWTVQVMLLWIVQVMLLWWNCHTWNRSGHTAVVELSLNRSGHAAVVEFLLWTVQIMLLSVLNSSDHVSVNSSGHGAVVELSHSEQIRSCCGGWIVTEQFRSCCCGWIVTLDSSGPATVCLDWTYPQESGSPAAAALLLLLFYFLFYLKSFHIGNINLILPLSR